ncbi:2-oxo-4-hydroxy-4-carboxy-5-ureidoimidazoline decarboxylase [Amycolatopsis xylanica]|uniref:2-oxo-4-hydroxy-4-carboxy-5-ureidoimidazoline decarboxylase n=1 Tax=Amycolatopsis xylanica TaxID=589385 RepID=A0A1H2UHG6_9PSEU|nr:2-oxo-4-hydroxy-4-carboxy-5-ureidoimidazoline decarboxylase [Amycolatopsis xylanica]SDW55606.1 2-oxo-4-hydroxy-4-carboxy-5-ureidoimidazoline decarboxylase [Amycolatopsis xylanica]
MFDQFNTHPDAERGLLACCASPRWASRVAARRPFADVDALVKAGDAELATLEWDGIAEALSAHPRIGDRATGTDREAVWSRGEQAAAAESADDVKAQLAAGNAEYERRFDRVFLICATGLGAPEILAALRSRLGNDDETEREVVREELRKIVALRLRKLVAA